MKVYIEEVMAEFSDEPESDEKTVVFRTEDGKNYHAFSSIDEFEEKQECDVTLDFLDSEPGNDKARAFAGNPQGRVEIIRTDTWSYDGYGRIESVNPTIVSFGSFDLEIGIGELKETDVGRYVYWYIDRLDIERSGD
jgi:hypothetical protein